MIMQSVNGYSVLFHTKKHKFILGAIKGGRLLVKLYDQPKEKKAVIIIHLCNRRKKTEKKKGARLKLWNSFLDAASQVWKKERRQKKQKGPLRHRCNSSTSPFLSSFATAAHTQTHIHMYPCENLLNCPI